MENDNQPVTKKDLNEAFDKFAQDILIPAFESIDERFNVVDEKFKAIDQQLVNIQAELSDIKSEISAIKGRLNQIEIRLDRLEKMVEGDSRMANAEIAELKKANQDITNRLTILEGKSVSNER